MKTSNPLISVIIPVYNVEKYLERCVDSVINQTYKNLEIILVDDGSTDKCPDICDNFVKLDDRINVIHQKNKGISEARNVAIDICSGKFIFFLDSDDYIAVDTINFLYLSLIKNNCEISTCNYVNVYEDIPKINMIDNREFILCGEAALEDMLYQKNVTTSAWGKLYSAHLFENIRYPKNKICEDLEVTYLLFSRSKKIVINSSVKLYYQQRVDSIIHAKFSIGRIAGLMFADKILKSVTKDHSSIILAAQNRYFMEAIFIIIQIPVTNIAFRNEYEMCKTVIKKYRSGVLFDSKSRLAYRLCAAYSFMGCGNMVRMFNLMSNIRIFIARKKR